MPQGVEVRHLTGIIAVGDTGGLQVDSEHVDGVLALRHPEHWGRRELCRQECSHRLGQSWPEWLRVLAAPLAVGRRHGHSRRVGVQVE
ncbi:MAG TPA: hypothetical protein VH120_04110 [Gemmataceae bacterium]|nr:hypothetical protein [Gemmataceae bacterium]